MLQNTFFQITTSVSDTMIAKFIIWTIWQRWQNQSLCLNMGHLHLKWKTSRFIFVTLVCRVKLFLFRILRLALHPGLNHPEITLFFAHTPEDMECVMRHYYREHLYSLRHSESLGRHKSPSILAKLMACCLTAPSHYLNQYWLISRKVHKHSPRGIFTWYSAAINH